LIDPVVAGLLNVSGTSVATNANAIASATTGVVKGAAADGTTQVILHIPASNAGQQFTVTVIDATSPSTSVPNDGGVFALGGSPASASISLAVTAVTTTSGPEAFALYLAPVNFSRSSADYTLTTRSVTLQVSSGSAVTGTASVTVARPPVVLVHGLWGSAASFSNFTPLTTDSIFDINYATYDNAITGITSTTPSYPASDPIEANSLGFAYNASSVLAQINNFIAGYRTSANVASGRAFHNALSAVAFGDILRFCSLVELRTRSWSFCSSDASRVIQ
jgi:hypothetical protein